MPSQHCNDATSYRVADTCVTAFLLFPAMVFYWRGIWDLIGVYIFPDDEMMNHWTIFGIGCGTIFGYVFHPLVEKGLKHQNRPTRFVLTRVYMAVYAVFPMAYWRGVWTLADYYLLEYGWKVAIINYFILEVLLHVLRVRQTGVFPPLFVAMDTRKDVLSPGTRFNVKPGFTFKYAMDALFSHFVALTLTIWLWQSAWTCVDSFMSSLDYTTTNYICLLVGYVAVLTVLFMDPLFLRVSKYIANNHSNSTPMRRFVALIAWEDFVYLAAFWSHLFLWRGCWNLNAEFIIADPEIGGWVNNLVGTVGFLVLQVYSYVGFCGCAMDGWLDGSQDRVFQTHYTQTVMEYFTRQKRSTITDKESLDVAQDTFTETDNNAKVYAISYGKVNALESRLWPSMTSSTSTTGLTNEIGTRNSAFEDERITGNEIFN